jgi:hypothetical protein
MKLADQLGHLVDVEAEKLNDKFPGIYKRAQQDEGVVLDCYGWFFRVGLDAIGIGEGCTIWRSGLSTYHDN